MCLNASRWTSMSMFYAETISVYDADRCRNVGRFSDCIEAVTCVGFISPIITEETAVNCKTIWLYFQISFRCHLNRIIPRTKSLGFNGLQICFCWFFQASSDAFRSANYIFSLHCPVITRYTVRRFTRAVYLCVHYSCDNKVRLFVCTA
jgi:hypothetical protein